MLSAVTLAARPEFSLHSWMCRPDSPDWSAVECPTSVRLVLVRSGRFRRYGHNGPIDLDPTVGYLAIPGEDERFAHPHGGDECTSVQLSEAAWHGLVGESRRTHASVYIDARIEFAHRRMLAAGPDVDYALADRLLGLTALALRQTIAGRTPLHDRPVPADTRLVEQARAAIHDDHPAARGLFSLAELLSASPYRLSRAFPRELGVSLTRYRNRVRVGWALERLQHDTAPLAEIAVTLGFADQAHFTRVVRQHLYHTPTAIRRAISPLTRRG